MNLSKFIFQILDTGVVGGMPRGQIKNTRLLNAGCIAWIPLNIIFIIEDLLLNPDPLLNVLTFFSTALILVLVIYFQQKQWHIAARVLFILLSLVHYMVFAVFLEPGSFLEYFFMLIPIFTLIFFSNNALGTFSLLASFACFTFTMVYFQNYPGLELQHIANFALFFAIYLAFAYFKNLNVKSEKNLRDQRNQAITLLEKIEQQRKELEIQRNQAIESSIKIENQRKELEELNRFQSLFWVNLSHEIRTPLTLIKGSSRKLPQENDSLKLLQHYQCIEKNTDKIQLLIDNIMDLAKIKANKLDLDFKTHNLVAILKRITASFEPIFTDKQINYCFRNSTGYSGVYGLIDALYFERALSNVLLNAYKYTSENGNVDIYLNVNETFVSITISDSGCGIPEADQAHIFEAFFRSSNTVNQAGGTGVGLSFAKDIVKLHGGEISVKSQEETGSSFTITIPVIIEVTNIEERKVLSPENIDMSFSSKILLVEDNPEMRSYIKDVLVGYSVIEASDGLEALECLTSDNFDLIITDYMMPGMNGYQFISHIRRKGDDTPVIVLTARIDKEAKMDFLRLGIDDYLNKPFNEEELIIRINNSIKNNEARLTFIKEEIVKEKIIPAELEKIKEIIESNFKSTAFGILNLADILSTTERTLHRKIKACCGLTPNGLIREIKLQKAKALFESGEVGSLKELASEVGFVNSAHLSKLFFERFGIKLRFHAKLI